MGKGKLAVLIPSRNERYLNPTIDDCVKKAAGEVEVIVTLEGYWPSDWGRIAGKYANLHTIHHGEPHGLRAAVNSAANSAISRGAKYLLKLDAHCKLDEGYDEKLKADMDHDWIVVPRRKRLNAENWTIQDVGKPDVDYHYLSFPDNPQDFGGPGLNGKVWDQRIRERLNKPEYDIDDELSSQGSAWGCHAAYFTKLELMDEAHWGPFWCEAQEVLMKAWLSGGRCVVNKKTWYAHLHKGRTYAGEDGKGGRGYHLDERWLKMGRDQTMKWVYNEAWEGQTKPFEWLIDHFWPVPTWPQNWREVLYATRKPRALLGQTESLYETFPQLQSSTGLVIHSARYGPLGAPMPFREHSIDVAERVRSLVKNGSLDIVVNNSTLTPSENPFRGKKKVLLLTYSIDGGEPITIEREEKDWLIIGPVRPRDEATGDLTPEKVAAGLRQGILEPELVVTNEGLKEVAVYAEVCVCGHTRKDHDTTDVMGPEGHCAHWGDGCICDGFELKQQIPTMVLSTPFPDAVQSPITAPALNDYLIRRFQISPQRLRGPMPIELRDFHRNDLAQLFAELGFKRGAEIGVAEGNYSEILLKANPECELLLVDPWHAYSDNPQNKSKEKHEYAYNETKRKAEGYNVRLCSNYSMQVVQTVANESLDFVYIDGNHLFDYVIQDLIEWSKRVRSGGIVSGDDYYALDQKRWGGGGVVEAVQAYTNAHRIPIWYLFAGHKSVDFMWVKP